VRNLQNVLHNLARIRVRVKVMVRLRIRCRVRVTFRSELCKLQMYDFETVQHILQIAQIDKSHATVLPVVIGMY